ncbi:MAG TPA: HAMP domain-containing protein, partial [Longimicrobiaceae bacterium]|nr:HAMP domain-containing protein [Longimicrobiaceae bacterium]
MTLRTRIALALLAITVVLVAPAIYALTSLSTLGEIARDLRTVHTASLLRLGELQEALGEIENQQRSYYVLGLSLDAAREGAMRRVEVERREVDAAIRDLAAAGYAEAAAASRREWERVQRVIARERELIEAGDAEAAENYRFTEVNDAFGAMTNALQPIRAAIDEEGERQVVRAEILAARAATIVFTAVAIALTLALLIAYLLTRSLLRPIDELRQAMAVVAGGDFNPQVARAPDRQDELGDLARSFSRMTEQLAELDRLKAEFISIASHELKTPLSVIRGYVSLLLEGIYGAIP